MLSNETLKRLQSEQKKLDEFIRQEKNLTDTDSRESFIRIKIALLVEIGELANELKTFKHWKSQKEVDWEKAKEELIDCLHFYLSWANSFQIDFSDYKFKKFSAEPSYNELLLALFSETENFSLNVPWSQKITIAEPPYKFQIGDKQLVGEIDRKTIEEEIMRFMKKASNLDPTGKGYLLNKQYLEGKAKKLQDLISQSIGFLGKINEEKNGEIFARFPLRPENVNKKPGVHSSSNTCSGTRNRG